MACDRERSGGRWSARRGHGDPAVPADDQHVARSSPAAASPRGTSAVMTSPSRRVVRVSATYRSAWPRGDACSIPAGSMTTTRVELESFGQLRSEHGHRCVQVRSGVDADRGGGLADLCGRRDHGRPPGSGQLGLTPDQPGEIAVVPCALGRLAGVADGDRRFGAWRQERGGQCHRGFGGAVVHRQPCGPPAPGRHRVEHLRPGAGAAGRDSGAGTSAVPPSARTVITCLPAQGSFRLPGPLDEARFTSATSCVTGRPEQSRKAACRLAGHLARAAASVPEAACSPRCSPVRPVLTSDSSGASGSAITSPASRSPGRALSSPGGFACPGR
jgi:hypothetical protein